MHDHDITSGSPQPDVSSQSELDEEQVLAEAARESISFTLAGCLLVTGVVLPRAVLHLGPVCAYVRSPQGEHPIPSVFVWKDHDTLETYCSLQCAARAAIDKAARISPVPASA